MRLAKIETKEFAPTGEPIARGEGSGALAELANRMKSVRTGRGAKGGIALSDRRHIYVVGAAVKIRAEISQLATAVPEAHWQDFSAGHDFLRAAGTLATGCVLVCDPLPDIEALAVVSWLGEQRPDLASIVVSTEPTVSGAVNSLKAGAADYLSLPLDKAAAMSALSQVFEPRPDRLTRTSALARLRLTSRLSQRELQVLEGLLAGQSNKAVGGELKISERTVEVHRSRIMRRLGVDSFAELVRMSVQAGIGKP